MDVWVNFTHATKWQAEGIFKCFFPYKASSPVDENADKDTSQKNLPLPKRKAFKHAIPLLTETEICELAKKFADAIPEDELSVSLCLDMQILLRVFIYIFSRLPVFKATSSRIRLALVSVSRRSPNGSFRSARRARS